jgi:hypothetical protein
MPYQKQKRAGLRDFQVQECKGLRLFSGHVCDMCWKENGTARKSKQERFTSKLERHLLLLDHRNRCHLTAREVLNFTQVTDHYALKLVTR